MSLSKKKAGRVRKYSYSSGNSAQALYETGWAAGFDGIDRRERASGSCAVYDMKNLRPLPDGSVTTREGFVRVTSLPRAPRAVFADCMHGYETLYALIGDEVYTVDDDGFCDYLADVRGSTGDGAIFRFGKNLFVLDGGEFFVYDNAEESFIPVDGYVPLYGNGWDAEKGGKVNEPLNLVSRKFRIRFVTHADGAESVAFRLPYSSIDKIIVNGEVKTRSEVGISSNSGTGAPVTASLPEDSEIIFWLTLPLSAYGRDGLVSCTSALTMGQVNDGRLCFYRGNDVSRIYFSRPITEQSAAASAEYAPASFPLYFPENCAVDIGDGREPVTAVCPHAGRYLIFTPDHAYVCDPEGKECDPGLALPSIVRLSRSGGCDHPGIPAFAGDDPLTLCGGNILRWHCLSGDHTEYSYEVISDGLTGLIPAVSSSDPVFATDNRRGEAWIAWPDDTDGRVLIFSARQNKWFSFTGIRPDLLFMLNGRMSFIRDHDLFSFDPDAETDASATDISGSEDIPASLTLGWMDFGHPEYAKRTVRIMLRSRGESPDLIFSDGRGASAETLMCAVTEVTGSEPPMDLSEEKINLGGSFSFRCEMKVKSSRRTTFGGISFVTE